VLFDVPSMPDYGKLSNRTLDDMIAGARVEVAPYKRDPMDFVLWKPSKPGEPAWQSPWSNGRPGWHIECSAMAGALLGDTFDIHGGGIDLIFPHHENEIAQSRCAHGTETMARYWLHNGFLQVEGEKMSKSLGNFVTVNELLATEKFGGRRWSGPVLRLAMLMTHYRQPIDWKVDTLHEAERVLAEWSSAVSAQVPANAVADDVIDALSDDLNTPLAITRMHALRKSGATDKLHTGMTMLGIGKVAAREVSADVKTTAEALIGQRRSARAAKNFAEADRIRKELDAMGIALKDSKDPKTGELVTTWEVKR
jgi:cysteinyl-tRNA synthetase